MEALSSACLRTTGLRGDSGVIAWLKLEAATAETGAEALVGVRPGC